MSLIIDDQEDEFHKGKGKRALINLSKLEKLSLLSDITIR